MSKVLTLYSNKGGVSKTTTTFNIAAFIAKEKNKKVLIIDADPQCNITELFFSSLPEDQTNPDFDLPGTSILEAFKPRFRGEASKVDITTLNLPSNTLYPNLYILKGDIEFSAQGEQYFASSIQQAVTNNVNEKNTYVAFRRLIEDLINQEKFDYVLIDVGPSSGAITRQAFLSCDFFVIPITPDRFSYKAISVLANLYKEWSNHDRLVMSTLSPFNINIGIKEPKFLGSINQNFKSFANKIKHSYARWTDKIKESLVENIMSNDAVPVASSISGLDEPFVAHIQDLGVIVPISQVLGKAIYDINQQDSKLATEDEQIYRGAVWTNWETRMGNYKSQIEHIYSLLEKA